jgi:hypothetical protein
MIFSSANRGKGSGTHISIVRFDVPGPEGIITTMELFRVLYCPSSPVNLISSGAMKQEGVIYDGITDKLIVKETNRELTHIEWVNNIAVVPCVTTLTVTTSQCPTTRLASPSRANHIASNIVD